MNIHPIPAFSDNYIWLVKHQNEAVCIDPGAADGVLAYLKQHRLTLSQMWITHHHNDHTGGIAALKQAFPECTVYGNSDITDADIHVNEGSQLSFGGNTVDVWATPGHTDTHLSYVLHISDGLRPLQNPQKSSKFPLTSNSGNLEDFVHEQLFTHRCPQPHRKTS
ncbi:MBL fold metallo-hydrolase, partial [Neisseria dumasiana]|uniref:MBL fold metallo-hydrolase n=1 Tax=Neisseria dumasiana TaxID=1931275 RepID=UPI000A22BC02